MQERALAAAQMDASLQQEKGASDLQIENARLLSEMQNLENELQSVERERDRSSSSVSRLTEEVCAPSMCDCTQCCSPASTLARFGVLARDKQSHWGKPCHQPYQCGPVHTAERSVSHLNFCGCIRPSKNSLAPDLLSPPPPPPPDLRSFANRTHIHKLMHTH